MGVLIANGKQQAITDTKLDELTREVREHNSYNGKLYKSTIDANVWAPDAYPAGWEAM